VGPAPYTQPREHEIVVRNHAVAINPLDWIIATASTPVSFEGLVGRRGRLLRLVPLMLRLAGGQVALMTRARRRGRS
jgi:hypothetical protein